jgi:hypothetical protein
LDAALFDEVVEEQVKRRGRKRIKGKKQATIKEQIKNNGLVWEEKRVLSSSAKRTT